MPTLAQAWVGSRVTCPTYSLSFCSLGPLLRVLTLTALSAETEEQGREWCILNERPVKGWEKGWVSSKTVSTGRVAAGVLRLSPGD